MQMHHQTAARLFRIKNCRLVRSQAQQVRVHLILGHEKVAAMQGLASPHLGREDI